MDIKIDFGKEIISLDNGTSVPLYSPQGFKIISDLWLKIGWDQKHMYSFTWLGRPIIQLPEDMFRIQELIYAIKPDLLIETGIAHGGSLIFYASLFRAMGKGRVIGVDIEIRTHNRRAIENHELYELITLIEGDSTVDETLAKVRSEIREGETVFVILDSYHSYDHVKKELEQYSRLITTDSYIVVTDGSQEYLHVTPRAKRDYPGYSASWPDNNPRKAVADFVANHDNFIIDEPAFKFNEGTIDFRVTHWPSCFLKKIK